LFPVKEKFSLVYWKIFSIIQIHVTKPIWPHFNSHQPKPPTCHILLSQRKEDGWTADLGDLGHLSPTPSPDEKKKNKNKNN
jgi:hypothetical protein